MKITFYGAARTTTGSMHMVEANGKRILLDCGLYQGHRKEAFEKNRKLPFNPTTIDYVILSHAHIDHSGNLPQLARNGFHGRVICRPATRDLCEVLLRDSCFLQLRDLEYVNKKRRAQGKNLFDPLYEEKDVDEVMRLFETVPMKREYDLGNGITLVFHNAGHILGSAQIQLDVREHGECHRILFSGDLGQPEQPILRHYDYPQGADIVLIESTYADRDHPTAENVKGRLKTFIDDIIWQRSKLVIPAFSVGRTQQILFYLNRLIAEGKFSKETFPPVYIDSPLSLKATKIYTDHKECYNDEASDILREGINPLSFPNLHFINTPEDSMKLNEVPGPMVIVAASGMCEGGRVLHHLKHCVGDPRNIVLIVGFQAENTLGRRIVERQSPLKILGGEYELRARVHTINALSAHADRKGLMDWFDGVKGGTVKHVFAVHGETGNVEAMVDMLKSHGAPSAIAPHEGQTFMF